MIRKFLFQTTLLLMFFSNAFAKHYLPVFTENWYTDATYTGEDSCANLTFSYANWYQGSDKIYAAKLLGNPPAHSDCQWGDVYLSYKGTGEPSDFIGTPDDWETIIGNADATVSEAWSRDCIAQDKTIVDQVGTWIHPSYICPVGSRASMEQGTTNLGCTDLPLACDADILGRDLAAPQPITIAGHVGLAMMQSNNFSSVLEVLQSPDGIFVNTLDDFKSRSNFWGEKYGLPQTPVLPVLQAVNILTTGSKQFQYPFTYTLTWNWHPGSDSLHKIYDGNIGQWESIYSLAQGALFRCDSFVYYCYLKGANLAIVPGMFAPPDVPKTIYDSFISIRFPVANGSSWINRFNDDIKKIYSSTKNNLSQREKIDAIFSEKQLDENVAGQLTYQYINSKDISRSEKITTFLSLLEQYQTDFIKFGYLLDCFSALQPIEATQALANLYSQQTSSEIKKKILFTLIDSTNIFANADQGTLDQNVSNILSIQQLFQNVLASEQDANVLKAAIQLYPSLVSPEQAKRDINVALQKEAESQTPLFDQAKTTLMQLQLAFETQKTQENDLPTLIDTLESQGNSIPYFPYDVCFILDNVPPEVLSDEVRPFLKKFLLTHKNELAIKNEMTLKNPNEFPPCNWLSAYASVMVKTTDEKPEFILKYIRSLNSSEDQAEYLGMQSLETLAQMNGDDRKYYKETFQNKLMDKTLSQKQRLLFGKGLTAVMT